VRAPAGPGRCRVDAGGLEVVATAERTWSPGAAVAIAVRPERVQLRRGAPLGVPSRPNEVPGTVEEVVFRGPLRRYRVRLPHGGLWSVDEPAAAGAAPLERGSAVTVTWRPEDCRAIPDA
jgi:putative spermidine/putrescine transport system ATP-binding protein